MEMTLRDRVKKRRITHAFSLPLLGERDPWMSDARFWSFCWKIVPTLFSFRSLHHSGSPAGYSPRNPLRVCGGDYESNSEKELSVIEPVWNVLNLTEQQT